MTKKQEVKRTSKILTDPEYVKKIEARIKNERTRQSIGTKTPSMKLNPGTNWQ